MPQRTIIPGPTAGIVDGSVTEAMLAKPSVDTPELFPGAVENGNIADGAVSNNKIATGALRNSLWNTDYANQLAQNNIENFGVTPISLVTSGTYAVPLQWKGRSRLVISGLTGDLELTGLPWIDDEGGDYPFVPGDTVTLVNNNQYNITIYASSALPGTNWNWPYDGWPEVLVLTGAQSISFTCLDVTGSDLWYATGTSTDLPGRLVGVASSTGALVDASTLNDVLAIVQSGSGYAMYSSQTGVWTGVGPVGNDPIGCSNGAPTTVVLGSTSYFADANAGNVVINIPSGLPNGTLIEVTSIEAHGGGFTVTLNAPGGGNINGIGSVVLSSQYESVSVRKRSPENYLIVTQI